MNKNSVIVNHKNRKTMSDYSVKKQNVEAMEPELIRDRNFTLRLTGEEYEQLTSFCKERRISKSHLTRKVLAEIMEQ